MLLKSLELQGFKTFPDKTLLSFNKGITAVVGPNGSGKSNISDAVRWVLGEQSVKNLRCSKMEDVVFSGTPTRKAQGFAEVTLTIDNSDRKLPFEGDEVAVTRRYYRSGDSEYLINKASVRLRDIHELFMDTGLGRDGYSMIGQGKIDSIVASRSEDRREIFEEAAGISRFRYRKEEAERRLSQAEENLLRLRDILQELEDRVGPLAEQAEKAKQYLSYAEEKRTLEIGLWLQTLQKSGQLLREQEDKITISRSQHEEAEQAIEAVRRDIEGTFQQSNALTARADELRRQSAELEESAARKDGEVSVLQNDIQHNGENIARMERDRAQTAETVQDMDAEIQTKNEAIEQKKTYIEDKNKALDACIAELEGLRAGMSEFSGKMDSLTADLSALSVEMSDCRVKSMTAASSASEIETRLAAVESGIEARQKQSEELQKASDELTGMLKDTGERIESLLNTVKGYEIRLTSRKNRYEEAKKLSDKLNLDTEEQLRRARLLEELERNLEGFAQSVKVVMKESNRGLLHGVHGPVSRLIQVPQEYTVAIEIALGAAMQNIVVGTEEDAKAAINLLKQRDGGRATFLPLTSIRGNAITEKGLDDCPGYVGLASELCTCEKQYEGVLKSLLGRIAVAEDLDSAVAIARRFSYRFRIVTLDGQVVNAGGSLTGGSLAKNSGLLSRASEIERIKKVAAELKTKAAKASEDMRTAQQEASAAEAQLIGARGELAAAQEEQVKIEAEHKNTLTQIDMNKSALRELEQEHKTALLRLQEFKSARDGAEKRSAELSLFLAQKEKELGELSGSREELTGRRETLTEAMQQIRLDIVAAEKDMESLRTAIEDIERRKLDHFDRRESLQREIKAIEARNALLQVQIDNLKNEAENLREKAQGLKQEIEATAEKRMELEKLSSELRAKERDKMAEMETAGRSLARLEEQKIGLQKGYDEIIARLWEEYELTRREAEEIGANIENTTQAQKRLNELKNKIKNLGTVNVGAIEEYKEVSERYEFLRAQVQDVEHSRDELNRLIIDLTRQMRELFIVRFRQINEHFGHTFRELFGGGTAGLTLSDEEDILNSGIEITAQPPGKIVTHLELLSGGEKALVAIALYFAIMKVSPPPFCMLDEIEAALDDVNVDRFASYLRRMNDNTQFIVITHRRGTMEEADVLYGVTMQDEGVSKLLELRASEIEQKLGMK